MNKDVLPPTYQYLLMKFNRFLSNKQKVSINKQNEITDLHSFYFKLSYGYYFNNT